MKEEYEKKKQQLSQMVQNRAAQSSEKISLYKDSSNLFRTNIRKKDQAHIDVRQFNRVIGVDRERKVAAVEGMATYEEIVRETLKYGLLPKVVPQLKTITIGGAIAGAGIESSSFRYGLVHESINEMEILLGDGRVVVCRPDNEFKDLFFAFPNTYGTLGYTLKVDLQLIEAARYVKLTHQRFAGPVAYFAAMNRLCAQNRSAEKIAFVDGVIFDRNEMYITTGEFVDEAPYVSDYKYMHIYYRSIQKRQEDYLTTSDYIWRWDADWFWCSSNFNMQNPVVRGLFGKWMLKSAVYTKIMRYVERHDRLARFIRAFKEKQEAVIQDILIPVEQAKAFFDFYFDTIKITPVWICPTRVYSQEARYPFCDLDPQSLYLDFGFWGHVKTDKPDGYYNRRIEKMAKELSGFKSLYSASFYTKKEFWDLFDQDAYSRMKQKYDPHGLLYDLYDKINRR